MANETASLDASLASCCASPKRRNASCAAGQGARGARAGGGEPHRGGAGASGVCAGDCGNAPGSPRDGSARGVPRGPVLSARAGGARGAAATRAGGRRGEDRSGVPRSHRGSRWGGADVHGGGAGRAAAASVAGNVRELGNAIDRAAALCDGGVIQGEDLGLDRAGPAPKGVRLEDLVAAGTYAAVHEAVDRFLLPKAEGARAGWEPAEGGEHAGDRAEAVYVAVAEAAVVLISGHGGAEGEPWRSWQASEVG